MWHVAGSQRIWNWRWWSGWSCVVAGLKINKLKTAIKRFELDEGVTIPFFNELFYL